jgi:DNA-binding transcriptional LysR family regulator
VDIRQLQILRELGELGSARAVAEALRITPSAVSQQLQLLQRPIAVPLTRREGRTLRLTEAGQALAAAAVEVESALSRAREIAKDLTITPRGPVSLSAFNSAALAFFPALVAAFPAGGQIRVILTDQDVEQSAFPPLTSSHDIVLAHRFAHTDPWPSTVTAAPLLTEPLDVALPADHPLARRRSITAHAAATEPWITTHQGFPVEAITHALATVSGQPVTVVHRVNEFTVAAELVRAGAGLALIPRWTTPAPAGVVLKPLRGVRSTRQIDALIRPENLARPSVSAVLAALRQVAADLASGQPTEHARERSR